MTTARSIKPAKWQEERIAGYIENVIAAWPPLTNEQRTKLAELLKPVRVSAAELQADGSAG